jgi:hypothetical protein
MAIRAALITGTAVSMAVTAIWSYTANLTIGTPPVLHLSLNLPGDYMQLAHAATGNAAVLFTVNAVIYAACLFVSGLRQYRRMRGGG